ncbi:MAG: outer membrane lipoprotein chaperone LolA [Acidobacteriota bacterium]|jgi:outer membrane lipoprotein carrier protein|nr:outer membrane lipoprotein chaperone LolA [Acidobacteriota bacterium]
MRFAFLFLCTLSGLASIAAATASDPDAVVAALQQRYASVRTVAGSFQQTYRAPGIDQTESGVFRMKRPGLMRWEYRQPEEKLFIADGREVFLYSPRDRQVTIQPFSASDIQGTPLEFLLGGADILKTFSASWESRTKPTAEQTAIVRLKPRTGRGEYEFLVLEIDTKTSDLRRIVIHEHGGNTSEFLLTHVTVNGKMGNNEFQFKPPKGVEVVRMDSVE